MAQVVASVLSSWRDGVKGVLEAERTLPVFLSDAIVARCHDIMAWRS